MLICPARAGQDKVKENFTEQTAGCVSCNLSTCDKLYTLDIIHIFYGFIFKETNKMK
jgi:hypothetical protein